MTLDTFPRSLFLAGVLAAVGIALYVLLVLRRTDRRVAVVLGAAAVLVLIGAGVEAHRVGLATRYGETMAAGCAIAGLVAVGAIVALRPALWLALGLAVVPSLSEHARDPGLPLVNFVVDVLHVLAASAWVGALVGVVLLPGERRRAGLLAAGGVVLVAVAVLVQIRPGRNYVPVSAPPATLTASPDPPPPPRDAVVLAREAGSLAVALEAEPAKTTVIVLSPAGGGMSGLSVRFVPSGVAGSPCGSGCYAAAVALHGRVGVSIGGFGPAKAATFDVPSHAPPAAATVRELERAYRALPGVTYIEHLASSPTESLVARWRLERPNRLSYVVEGDGGGIAIGTRRWDQNSPRGRWVPSSQIPALPEPNTLWERATNAHLLSVAGRWETVSFADPGLGAFFTATIDRRTLRPRVVHMIATAHFMIDRYVGFNPRREIRPPR